MNWKRRLVVIIECAFDLIPESQHEEFFNYMIKIIFEYCGGIEDGE